MVTLRSGNIYITIDEIYNSIEKLSIVINTLFTIYNTTDIEVLLKQKLNKNLYTRYSVIQTLIHKFIHTSVYLDNYKKDGSKIDSLITNFIVTIKYACPITFTISIPSKICLICYDTMHKKQSKVVCRDIRKHEYICHNYHRHCLQEYIKYASHPTNRDYVVYPIGDKTYIKCLYCDKFNHSLCI